MVVDKMSMIYEALLELHAEMVLDEAIRQFQEQKLYEEIDKALLRRDEPSFRMLTEQLKMLKMKENETAR
jgi:uncharacterized protein YpiB (UPF0302 family)